MRTDELPSALAAPVIELQRGAATLRLYAADQVPLRLRSMMFDCLRTADGDSTVIDGPLRLPGGPTVSTVRDLCECFA